MSARTRVVPVLAAMVFAGRAEGQDLEALAELRGRSLPAAYWERVARDPLAFTLRAERAGYGPGVVAPGQGDLRLVVLPGLFADSPEPPVTAESMQRRLFGDNPGGSLSDYYREVSGGRVRVTGTVLPWVRTRFTRADVAGASAGLGGDAALPAYLRQVVQRLDARTDFGAFDNDGPDGIPNSGDDDGSVDLAVFQVEGRDASCGGEGIWPHRFFLGALSGAGYPTDDLTPRGRAVLVDDYIVQSATDCGGAPQSVAVVAHETGHAFGLRDFYDATDGLAPARRRWILGCWSLMAAGAWGCGDGAAPGGADRPPHMGAFEKARLGWATFRVTEPGWRRAYTLGPVQRTGEVLRVPLRGANEYLLLEYRPAGGFDARLPAGGILVYHVDSLRPYTFRCNGCERRYHVRLVEADGDSALLRPAAEGGDRGAAGDAWTGRRVLDAASTPALVLNSGLPANVALELEVAGGEARVVVSTLPDVPAAALLAPVLLSPGAPPGEAERLALDHFGNRNGRYDLGDLRAYMRSRPGAVVPG